MNSNTKRSSKLSSHLKWSNFAHLNLFIRLISLLFQYKQDPSNSSIENDAAWCRFDSGEYSEHGFYITFFFSSYAIPMILIIFLYIAMLRRLWNPGSIGKQISKESLRNKKRVTRQVFFPFSLFFKAPIFFFGSGRRLMLAWCFIWIYHTFMIDIFSKFDEAKICFRNVS